MVLFQCQAGERRRHLLRLQLKVSQGGRWRSSVPSSQRTFAWCASVTSRADAQCSMGTGGAPSTSRSSSRAECVFCLELCPPCARDCHCQAYDPSLRYKYNLVSRTGEMVMGASRWRSTWSRRQGFLVCGNGRSFAVRVFEVPASSLHSRYVLPRPQTLDASRYRLSQLVVTPRMIAPSSPHVK